MLPAAPLPAAFSRAVAASRARGCATGAGSARFVRPESASPATSAPAIASATAAGTTTKAVRRAAKRRRGGGGGTALARARTRARSSGGAGTRAVRICSSSSGCDIRAHPLFELLQRPAQPCRAGGRGDPEHAGSGLAVQIEQDAERDHLALAGRELRKRALERRREAAEHPVLVLSTLQRVCALATPAPLLGPEVVERRRAREVEEPGPRAAAPRVEPAPLPERLLERLGGQVLGSAAVPGQVDEVAVDVVEVALDGGFEARHLREHRHAGYTPPAAHRSHGAHGRLVDPVAPEELELLREQVAARRHADRRGRH